MYGRSKKTNPLGASGYYENNHHPFDIDRHDGTPNRDYPHANEFEPEHRPNDYRSSRYTRGSKREPNLSQESGIYPTRIESHRDFRNTSTPTPHDQSNIHRGTAKHEMDYRQTTNTNFIGQTGSSLGRTKSTVGYLLIKNNNIEDEIEIVESPRSVQWPETARSYPVGFEAEHVAPYTNPRGESSDQGSIGRSKIDNSYIETPSWAKLLLTKEFSLTEKFRNMRKAINKWSLRPYSEKIRTPLDNIQQDRLTMYDMFGNKKTTVNGDSTQHLISTEKGDTNNLAVFLWGLFLIFILVFPVIFIVVIFNDPADLVQVDFRMNFTGSLGDSFNYRSLGEGICGQLYLAVESYSGYYGCDITAFRNDTLIAEASLLFQLSDFPYKNNVGTTIDNHFSTLPTVNVAYVNSSTLVVNYKFVRSRLIVQPFYNSTYIFNQGN